MFVQGAPSTPSFSKEGLSFTTGKCLITLTSANPLWAGTLSSSPGSSPVAGFVFDILGSECGSDLGHVFGSGVEFLLMKSSPLMEANGSLWQASCTNPYTIQWVSNQEARELTTLQKPPKQVCLCQESPRLSKNRSLSQWGHPQKLATLHAFVNCQNGSIIDHVCFL